MGDTKDTPLAGQRICEYGKAQYQRGLVDDAVHEFTKLLSIDPDNAVAKAFIALPPKEKELEKARKRLDILKEQQMTLTQMMEDVCPYPDDACDYFGTRGSLCEYAVKLYKEGNVDDAKHEFGKLLMLDPENPTAAAYLEHMDGSCLRLSSDLVAVKQEIAMLLLKEKELASHIASVYQMSCE